MAYAKILKQANGMLTKDFVENVVGVKKTPEQLKARDNLHAALESKYGKELLPVVRARLVARDCTYHLPEGKKSISIGRSDGNDIRISAERYLQTFDTEKISVLRSVSPKHAMLTYKDGKFFITNIGGTRGTYVNYTFVGPPVEVNSGDTITLGKYQMLFVVR